MSQNNSILEYLKQGNSITSLEALKSFQCMRLARVINDLKNLGHVIHSEMITIPSGKRVASYSLGIKNESAK